MKPGRLLRMTCLVLGASLLSSCQSQQVEIDRLKQENARLSGERDAARRELEQLRAAGSAATSPAAPAVPAVPTSGPVTFTDLDDSAALHDRMGLRP